MVPNVLADGETFVLYFDAFPQTADSNEEARTARMRPVSLWEPDKPEELIRLNLSELRKLYSDLKRIPGIEG